MKQLFYHIPQLLIFLIFFYLFICLIFQNQSVAGNVIHLIKQESREAYGTADKV